MPNESSTSLRPRPRPWGRILVLSVLGLVVLVLFGLLGFSLWLNSYLHSDAFRALLSRKTSALFQAEGEYMPFHWNGFSVYSDGYQARGNAGAPFRDLRADQIRAEFFPRGVLNRVWQINDLEIQRLQLTIGTPGPAAITASATPGAARRVEGEAPAEPRVAFAPAPAESRSAAWLPDRLDLRRTQIQQTDLNWGTANATGSLRQVRTVIEPEDRAWVATGYGGQLRQTGWPVLNIDHFKIRYQQPELFINDSLLKLGESENVTVSGRLDFGPQQAADLHIKFSGVNITPFLPEDWRAKLHGSASGESRLAGALAQSDTVAATGKLSLASAELVALPVLDRIALFTRTEQFRRITLQKAAADFAWTKAKLVVNHLVLESEGLIRVEGDFVVSNGALDGLFQVGVTPTSLRWLPGSQTRVFTVERDGYVWTAMRLTGPLNNLQEDLSPRLINAAGAEVFDDVKGTVEKGAKGVLDLLKPLLQ